MKQVRPDNTPRVALQDLYGDAQKGAPELALKDALQIALELDFFM